MARTVRRRGGSTRRRVVGLDQSLTSSGIANIDGTLETLKPKDAWRGPQRLVWIRDQVLERVATADLVLMEGYGYDAGGRRGKKGEKVGGSHSHALGELGGVLKTAMYENGIRYVVVIPQHIKMIATGKGNVSKEEVLVAAVKRLDLEPKDNNQSDAAWLRILGLLHLGLPVIDLPASHLRALDAVDWTASD